MGQNWCCCPRKPTEECLLSEERDCQSEVPLHDLPQSTENSRALWLPADLVHQWIGLCYIQKYPSAYQAVDWTPSSNRRLLIQDGQVTEAWWGNHFIRKLSHVDVDHKHDPESIPLYVHSRFCSQRLEHMTLWLTIEECGKITLRHPDGRLWVDVTP